MRTSQPFRLPAPAAVPSWRAPAASVAAALALSVLAPFSANATAITGTIYFGGGFGSDGYDPAYGGVPAGYGNTASNTVTVGSGVTFGFRDTYNLDTARFSASSLVLTDSVLNTGASSWRQTFVSDTANYFQGVTLASSSFSPSLTYAATANSLTVNWAGEYAAAPAGFSAQFNLASPASSTLVTSGVTESGGLYDYSFDVNYTGAAPGKFVIPLIGLDDIVGLTPMGITPAYTTDFGTAFHYVAAYTLSAGDNVISFESRNAPIEGPVGIDNGSYVTTIDPKIPGDVPGMAVPEPAGRLTLLAGTAALAVAGRRRAVR